MKRIIFILTISVFWTTSVLSAKVEDPRSGRVPRDRISQRFKWDLTHMFANDAAWHREYAQVKDMIPRFREFKADLMDSPTRLLAALHFRDDIRARLNRLRIYAKCRHDVALGSYETSKLRQLASSLASDIQSAGVFIEIGITDMSESMRRDFLKREFGLKPYSRWMERLAEQKKKVVSPEKEKLLNDAAAAAGNGVEIWKNLLYTEIPFGEVTDDNGQQVRVSRSQNWSAGSSHDRGYRERSWKALMSGYGRFRATLAALTINHMRGAIFQARARGYKSALQARIDEYKLPISAYTNLISTVRDNLAPLHRWVRIKKRVLGYEKLFPWDINVSLFPAVDKRFTWDDAIELNLLTVTPLGREYSQIVSHAFKNGWVDAYPHSGKEGGCYSSGAHPGIHPYVKMNFRGSILDVNTLVHEMGHMVHATMVIRSQPPVDANYMPFMGEIASTTPEILFHDRMASNAPTNAEKMYYLEQHINNLQLMIYTATMGAEFEKRIYDLLELGEAVTSADMDAIYLDLSRIYWGPDMTVDELEGHAWCGFPHWFLDYYIFSYATSFAASEQFAARIIAEGDTASRDFIDFLEAGRSAPPLEILKKAGVDMTTPFPIKAAIKQMDRLLDKLESLFNEQG